ncbi:MAG: tyrosine-type recombinase/integrase [Clostridiales bacterium]|jgi:site-specific recombinase XerD|nr:tyrosine-type recombinase/integrase [Clostridiales bacterium]MDR2751128.1 tyrosine-type recombinase/integrase [Clostridiales bacterium]
MNYHDESKAKHTLKLRSKLSDLPVFARDYFRGIQDTTSSLTRIAYARDLYIFFDFISREQPEMDGVPVSEMTLDDLGKVTPEMIEEYMEYLSYYIKSQEGKDVEIQNGERGKARKLSAVRSMFAHFCRKKMIRQNPSVLVDLPKLHGKNIIRLDADEIMRLIDETESGDHLTERQKKFHELTKLRDTAIIILLLGTGMRVSECVGIDVMDVDFKAGGVKVTRKGGDESVLYFNEEVEDALARYIEHRKRLEASEADKDALFLSLQKRRIGVRAVENLVKKYSALVTSVKKISPHKLRATYGTRLYQETGDIYLVADVLGHNDVNTTKKHYADMVEERRKEAANYVSLRGGKK